MKKILILILIVNCCFGCSIISKVEKAKETYIEIPKIPIEYRKVTIITEDQYPAIAKNQNTMCSWSEIKKDTELLCNLLENNYIAYEDMLLKGYSPDTLQEEVRNTFSGKTKILVSDYLHFIKASLSSYISDGHACMLSEFHKYKFTDCVEGEMYYQGEKEINLSAAYSTVYIRIPDFYTDFDSAYYAKQIKEKEIAIVDLRGNQGGFADKVIDFLIDLLIPHNSKLKHSQMKILANMCLLSQKTYLSTQNIVEAQKNQVISLYESFIFPTIVSEQAKLPHKAMFSYNMTNCSLDTLFASNPADYKGTVLLLVDRETSSAAEWLCIFLKYFLPENHVIMIGENTAGAIRYGDPVLFVLENTGIVIGLPLVSWCDIQQKYIPDYSGEGIGLIPDIRKTEEEINELLFQLQVMPATSNTRFERYPLLHYGRFWNEKSFVPCF